VAAPLVGPLDLEALRNGTFRAEPYPHLIASGCLRAEWLAALRRDFPRLTRPGYHPLESFTPTGAFAALLDQIGTGALEPVLSGVFGMNLVGLPRMVTVHFTASEREGRPHTDGERKVATLLIYMHPGWVSAEGRIRVLSGPALEPFLAELGPEEGNAFAFLRSDRSWHGHTPVRGERRVVQVTWLRDAEAAMRKRRAGMFAWWLKGLFSH